MADQVEEPTALAAAVAEAKGAEPPQAAAIKEEVESRPRGGSSSSSDDEGEKLEAVKKKVYRLFGRDQSVHHALGGGKSADILLWRDKKASAIVVGGATTVWVLFELIQYHLLTLACHILMLGLAVVFFWSYISGFINKSPPRIPEFSISEDLSVKIALALRQEMNNALYSLREIATGRNLKNFLAVITGLWVVSIIGGWFNLLTLLYIVFILLHTLPLLYEKHDEKVDSFAEKAMVEIKKHYAVLDDKVLSKIPRGPLKDKKH